MKPDKKVQLKRILVGNFTVIRLLRSVIIVFVCLIGFVYLFSDRIIFLPRHQEYNDANCFIEIQTLDGSYISACYLPSCTAEFTILYSHGNAENLGVLYDLFEMYRYNGFSIFAYDYHGYGTSKGKPSEGNAYQDIMAAYLYMVNNLQIPPEKIILLGRSVGGGPATHLASNEKVAGLILEGAFVSAFRVVTKIKLLPFDKFNNISKIGNIQLPVLVIHGTADRVVPFWHGQKLFDAANQQKYKFWVEAAGHNDLVDIAGENYWQAIKDFAETIKESP